MPRRVRRSGGGESTTNQSARNGNGPEATGSSAANSNSNQQQQQQNRTNNNQQGQNRTTSSSTNNNNDGDGLPPLPVFKLKDGLANYNMTALYIDTSRILARPSEKPATVSDATRAALRQKRSDIRDVQIGARTILHGQSLSMKDELVACAVDKARLAKSTVLTDFYKSPFKGGILLVSSILTASAKQYVPVLLTWSGAGTSEDWQLHFKALLEPLRGRLVSKETSEFVFKQTCHFDAQMREGARRAWAAYDSGSADGPLASFATATIDKLHEQAKADFVAHVRDESVRTSDPAAFRKLADSIMRECCAEHRNDKRAELLAKYPSSERVLKGRFLPPLAYMAGPLEPTDPDFPMCAKWTPYGVRSVDWSLYVLVEGRGPSKLVDGLPHLLDFCDEILSGPPL